MNSPTSPNCNRCRSFGRLFFGMFVLALIMGAGPGIYLINPDPNDPEAVRFIYGMPIVYVWASFWFIVQASAVALSYFLIWKNSPEPTETTDV